jgi:hypothetical protein
VRLLPALAAAVALTASAAPAQESLEPQEPGMVSATPAANAPAQAGAMPQRFQQVVDVDTSAITVGELLKAMMCRADVKILYDRKNAIYRRPARSVKARNARLGDIFSQLSSQFAVSIEIAPTGQVQLTTWPSEPAERDAWVRSRTEEVIRELGYLKGLVDEGSIVETASMLEVLQRMQMFEEHYISTAGDLEIFRPCVLRAADDLRRDMTYLQSTKTTAAGLIADRNQILKRLLGYFQQMSEQLPKEAVDRFEPTLQAALDTTARYQDITVQLVETKEQALMLAIDHYDTIQRHDGAELIAFADPATQKRFDDLIQALRDLRGDGAPGGMGVFELAPAGK